VAYLSAVKMLIGGGWNPAVTRLYGAFLERAGHHPAVACVVLDEGDGDAQFQRWRSALEAAAPCRPQPVFVKAGERLDVDRLDGADGLLVCGGLTPAYADALVPSAAALRDWLATDDRPYCGFSAGAAIAPERAVVGGYRLDERDVCPQAAAEDLEEVAVVAGLGLVPIAVDVHAAQWGTLGRVVAVIASGLVERAVALDENTALIVTDDGAEVAGAGAVQLVSRTDAGVVIRTVRAGQSIPIDISVGTGSG
jgi:cyanophycinase